MKEIRKAHRTSVEKPQDNLPLRRQLRKWEDNIKRYLRNIGREVTNQIQMYYA